MRCLGIRSRNKTTFDRKPGSTPDSRRANLIFESFSFLFFFFRAIFSSLSPYQICRAANHALNPINLFPLTNSLSLSISFPDRRSKLPFLYSCYQPVWKNLSAIAVTNCRRTKRETL